MSGTAALHAFAIWCRKCVKEKLVMNKKGVKLKSHKNNSFYKALMLDKFKQLESSQQTKLYPDTYSLQILSLNLSYTIIER